MNPQVTTLSRSPSAALSTNKVVRNTYMLLSMTLAFSAVTAGAAMALGLPHPGIILTLVGYYGLLFLTTKFRDSGLGIAFVFGLTGFMGYTLGPILSAYLAMPNGSQVVMMAMGGTAAIFLGLSAYVMTTRKDFSFMGGFLIVGILVAFLAGLGAIFFHMPALSLAVVYNSESGRCMACTSTLVAGLPVIRSMSMPAITVAGMTGPVENTTSTGCLRALPNMSCTVGSSTTW